ncbi:MAG: cation:proton antiporter [Nitrospirota bacterium]|nr:MAG: cation:proton antiporter [Nitrospirota bacterium]
MTTYFIYAGVGLCFLMFLALYRVILGPTAIDRLMGVNVIGTKTTVLLIVIGLIYGRVEMFVDIAIAYALLNFIATVGAARYFQHRKNLCSVGFGLRHKEDKGDTTE